MYRDSYQRGMLTVFFSGGSKPLAIWDTFVQSGYINRFLDQEIKSMVLEIGGSNISTTYMVCPKGNQVLGIHMPFMVMIVKNLMKYFSFEVTILDDTGTRRRFRVSNFQSKTQILPLCTVMPIGLTGGWNQIQFNLAEFTRRAYNKQFVEVQKLKINANIRLRRIYFTERLMLDDELPPEYKLYFPLQSKQGKVKKASEDKIASMEERKGSKLNVEKSNYSATILPITPSKPEQVLPSMAEDATISEPTDASVDKIIPMDTIIEGDDKPPTAEAVEGKTIVEDEIPPVEKQPSIEKRISEGKLPTEEKENTVAQQPSQIIEKIPSVEKTLSVEKIPSAAELVEDEAIAAINENANDNEQSDENAAPTV